MGEVANVFVNLVAKDLATKPILGLQTTLDSLAAKSAKMTRGNQALNLGLIGKDLEDLASGTRLSGPTYLERIREDAEKLSRSNGVKEFSSGWGSLSSEGGPIGLTRRQVIMAQRDLTGVVSTLGMLGAQFGSSTKQVLALSLGIELLRSKILDLSAGGISRLSGSVLTLVRGIGSFVAANPLLIGIGAAVAGVAAGYFHLRHEVDLSREAFKRIEDEGMKTWGILVELRKALKEGYEPENSKSRFDSVLKEIQSRREELVKLWEGLRKSRLEPNAPLRVELESSGYLSQIKELDRYVQEIERVKNQEKSWEDLRSSRKRQERSDSLLEKIGDTSADVIRRRLRSSIQSASESQQRKDIYPTGSTKWVEMWGNWMDDLEKTRDLVSQLVLPVKEFEKELDQTAQKISLNSEEMRALNLLTQGFIDFEKYGVLITKIQNNELSERRKRISDLIKELKEQGTQYGLDAQNLAAYRAQLLGATEEEKERIVTIAKTNERHKNEMDTLKNMKDLWAQLESVRRNKPLELVNLQNLTEAGLMTQSLVNSVSKLGRMHDVISRAKSILDSLKTPAERRDESVHALQEAMRAEKDLPGMPSITQTQYKEAIRRLYAASPRGFESPLDAFRRIAEAAGNPTGTGVDPSVQTSQNTANLLQSSREHNQNQKRTNQLLEQLLGRPQRGVLK